MRNHVRDTGSIQLSLALVDVVLMTFTTLRRSRSKTLAPNRLCPLGSNDASCHAGEADLDCVGEMCFARFRRFR